MRVSIEEVVHRECVAVVAGRASLPLPYQPLVVVAIALSAGISLNRCAAPTLDYLGFGTTWSGAVCLLVVWWRVWRGGQQAFSAWLLLTVVALAGAAWHDLRWNFYPLDEIARYAAPAAAPTAVTAKVLTAPEILPAPNPTPLRAIPGTERSRVEIDVTGIRGGATRLPAGGRCQLTVDGHLLGVHPGDEVQVFAQLRRLAPPRSPGEFDFAAHARSERRLTTLVTGSPESVTVVSRGTTWSSERGLEVMRARGRQLLRQYVGSERSALASAILLGARAGLPTEEVASFFVTGTIHLLVVSGLHVGILAMGLYAALRLGWLPRRTALALIVAVVVMYALVAEARPPVLRAAVLVVLMCIAAWTGRRGVAFNALAGAAVVILALNPCELFRTGTQLSFLCVATLIWVHERLGARLRFPADPLEQLIAASRPWYERAVRWAVRWNGWLLLATGAVWLTAMPLALFQFHVATPVALVIAPAVWVLVLLALWSGFLTLVCGWLWVLRPLATICGAACNASLAGLEGVVGWAESVPAGHVWAPGPPLWWVIGFYAGLIAAMLWGHSYVRPRWQVALLCLWLLAGFTAPLVRAAMRVDELRCAFVAVGHGTCVVLETPGGKTLLYDAGSLGSPEFATQTIAGYLWHRGILRIDAIILSHADVDHYNGVPGLLERFRVGAVYVSPQMFDWYGATGPSGGPDELQRAIELSGAPIHEIWAGDRLQIEPGVALDVLHPPQQGVLGSDNANSITLAVEHCGRRLLLPGDLESPGMDDLLAELPYDCDVVMAPHHGSRRSDPPGFAAWCTPEWVVISGRAEADPDVRQTFHHAGAQVLNTGEDGTVEFSFGPDGIRVERPTTGLAPRSDKTYD